MSTPLQQIFDSFAQSTTRTLKVMCHTDAPAGAGFEKGQRDQGKFDVAGLIGLTSATARGSIGLYFTEAVFTGLISKMLGEPVTAITSQTQDAAAELLNIIFGDAKVTLNQLGHGIRMASPTVLRGENVATPPSRTQKVRVIPFQVPGGEFFVEFALNPETETQAASAGKARGALTNSEKAAFFKPFVDGTRNTLKIQCNLDVVPGQPSLKKPSDNYSFDIAGLIGITSDSLTGSYLLSFRKGVFLRLLSRMLGEEFTEMQPGLEDGVAEMLNIILGSAKVTLNDQYGHAIQMALPTLVTGTPAAADALAGKTTIVIPFTSEIGSFMVEVTID